MPTMMDPTPADRAYLEAHRFLYGDLGAHVATAALLCRDRLLRPGFALPVIRLAPVAPYGRCAALSGNSGALSHAPEIGHGIWLYLHEAWFGTGTALLERADETVLHELLHNELAQRGQDPKHRGEPWAQRCQELSDRLGLAARIERPRSVRLDGKVITVTPDGCLPYAELARWPHGLMDGTPLRARALALPSQAPQAWRPPVTARGR
jgi:hypothetical protein